jgi:uncharacterized membrane protein YjgN (DUF898 family)
VSRWQDEAVTQPPPPGQPPYGNYPTDQYGAPYGIGAPDHPQATLVLVLGIVSVVACGLVGPFAWVIGNRVIREIDASGGQLGGRSNANAGRIIGMVITIITGIALLVAVAAVAILLIAAAGSST